jgi:signal transduction histidine kinase
MESKPLPINKNYFTLAVFGAAIGLQAVGLFLLISSKIVSAVALVNAHLGAQGLLVGARGPLSLLTKLLESGDSLFLRSIEFQQGERLVLTQTYEIPTAYRTADLLGLNISFQHQVGDYLARGTVVPPDFYLLVIIVMAGAVAGFVYGVARFYEWHYRLRMAEELSVRRNELAQQVSHDIRSPLSALNMVLGSLDGLPEEKRLIVRKATQRINDIANSLLTQSRIPDRPGFLSAQANASIHPAEPVMLVALLDSIISEKRTQFRNKMEVEIQGELTEGYGLFSMINQMELSRVISNLVNNSVEAVERGGRVTVGIRAVGEVIQISVDDNGKGIPSEVLTRLGERGVTYGKKGTQSGSGLGVYHARETIEKQGGSFTITSTVELGTKITLSLPKSETPSWFLEKIIFPFGVRLVSADDDQTIHQIWAGRFVSVGATNNKIDHLKFSDLVHFESWVNEHRDINCKFLVDYEFLGQTGNGLDTIERLNISDRAILVTSRFEEPQIRAKAQNLKLKILPKNLAPFVPIEFQKPTEKLDAIVIDDDKNLIHAIWKMAAAEKAKRVKCFSLPEDFWLEAEGFDPATPIYVDVNLADGVRGDEVAREILARGFNRVFLATGYSSDDITPPPGLCGVVGKDPIL